MFYSLESVWKINKKFGNQGEKQIQGLGDYGKQLVKSSSEN